MNKDDYKDALDQLEISPDFKEKTAKLMKETQVSKKNNHVVSKRLVFTFASAAVIIATGAVVMNNYNLFGSQNGSTGGMENSSILSVKDETEGITVPKTELPTEESSSVSCDMIGLFVYQGRIYTQGSTSFVKDTNYIIDKDDMLNLRGDYLGKTTGNITEWSKQEDYATEFASTIGESEIYTVKGYDSKYRLMVYSEYEGGFNCEIYDSFDGQLLTSGADYFDILKLQDNIVSYQWESYDSWNYGKMERIDANMDDTFQQFINDLYVSVPKGQMMDLFENMDYDSQKFIYVRTKDNLITTLRLFKDGYVYAPEVGFFKMDEASFAAFWNTMPVSAPAEEIESQEDSSSIDDSTKPATIDVTSNTYSYPVGTDSISLTIKNTGDEDIFYGVDYSIEQLSGDTWEVVPAAADLMFIEIAQILGPDSEQEFIVDLSQLKPSLEAGVYRIVKNINGETFYIKFELVK